MPQQRADHAVSHHLHPHVATGALANEALADAGASREAAKERRQLLHGTGEVHLLPKRTAHLLDYDGKPQRGDGRLGKPRALPAGVGIGAGNHYRARLGHPGCAAEGCDSRRLVIGGLDGLGAVEEPYATSLEVSS